MRCRKLGPLQKSRFEQLRGRSVDNSREMFAVFVRECHVHPCSNSDSVRDVRSHLASQLSHQLIDPD